MEKINTDAVALAEADEHFEIRSLPSQHPQFLVGLQRLLPWTYIAIVLPTVLLLCFLTPPMQSHDEGRHFLRAFQVASGQFVSQISSTGQAGGMLPVAVSDFVRDKMRPDFLRDQDKLPTISARLEALDRWSHNQKPLSEQKFAPFWGAAIYPPTLYLPQVVGISIGRLVSSKVYVWFYSARILDALAAVLLIFVALRLAPSHQYFLLIPAVLPISLYQISSVSADTTVIALSIVFVALCIRFVQRDDLPTRAALILSLVLLTLGKPVYLPIALLLLAAHSRLGWRRTLLFCLFAITVAGVLDVSWSYVTRPFIRLVGQDFPGHNPSAQIRETIFHPLATARVLIFTINSDFWEIAKDAVGNFGWSGLPLPSWLYAITASLAVANILLLAVNYRRIAISRFALCSLTAASLFVGVFLAGYVLWTPPGSPKVIMIQGRYLIPVLVVLAMIAPQANQLKTLSRVAMTALSIAFLLLSTLSSARIVKHYYFPSSTVVGKRIQNLFTTVSTQSCPAWPDSTQADWFVIVRSGESKSHGNFRVFLTQDDGTILAESDPVLAGSEYPYALMPGSSRSAWRVRLWDLDGYATTHFWFVTGKTACRFGQMPLGPSSIPSI